MTDRRSVAVVLFDGFELLDVFGPVELLAAAPELFELRFLGPTRDLVRSSQGIAVTVTDAYSDAAPADIVLVPGGIGTRRLAEDPGFLDWLRTFGLSASLVTSVCTGSGLLAAAGLLDGRRATSNKLAFDWSASRSDRVDWQRQARWVEDGDRWTSSGVAAGMDMTAALIRHLHGDEVADRITTHVELEVQRDPARDPFALVHRSATAAPTAD
ncbi:DJ-1/PfpI family protein [uncultured Amnibacterium sp.]|uniref:DJ-1/PfpI family protein n=1 Tax=uncultured Amnibacterium sp. TaxID=1631851 RepID=UPI0035CA779F